MRMRWVIGVEVVSWGAAVAAGGASSAAQASVGSAWQRAAAWPNPRAQAMAGLDAATGRIYLFGGYDGNSQGTPTAMADVFDPATNQWQSLAPMPKALRGGSVVLSGGNAYVYGGVTSASETGGVQIYNIAANTWTSTSPQITISAFQNEATASGSKHYIQGGEAYPNRLWQRDYVTGTMLRLPDAPNPHYGHGLLSYGGGIYAFGGLTVPANANSPVTAANDRYDLDTQTWSTVPADMPIACTEFAVDSDGRCFYVAGGAQTYLNGTQPFLNQFNYYDPAADLWQTGTALPEGLRDPSGVVAAGRFYVFGGIDTAGVNRDVYMISVPEPSLAWALATVAVSRLLGRRRAGAWAR